ncbi:MAG: helix-turn-helix transcriptional regulator [Chloroflexi bacterium]|nr:helix-turn-helix transcriptional regulator [Chloroflexota bacterium]
MHDSSETATEDIEFAWRFAELALRAAKEPGRFHATRAIGERVAKARQRYGLSRADLALRSGLGDFRIQLLEQGLLPAEELSFQDIQALAESLNVDVAALVEGEPSRAHAAPDRPLGRVLGYLRKVEGLWQWAPPSSPGLIPVSRRQTGTDSSESADVHVAVSAAEESLVTLDAGTRHGGWTLLVLTLGEDRETYAEIVRMKLKPTGETTFALPEGVRRLRLEVAPPDQEHGAASDP